MPQEKFLYMFTRRHIRIKVMQSVYALYNDPEQSLPSLQKDYKNQLAATYDLYFLLYGLLLALHTKAQEQYEIKNSQEYRKASALEKSPHLVNNRLLQFLRQSESLQMQLKKRKLNQWELHFDYVDQLLKILEDRSFYKHYLETDTPDWEADMSFVVTLYKDVIAPNDALFDFLEDQHLSWADDFALVNTFIIKQLRKIKPDQPSSFTFPVPVDQQEEKAFGHQLLETVVTQRPTLEAEIEGKTPNWETDRIAQLDQILLQLGIAELLYFDAIPPKVTLNEYLEIAKDYSTPKSNVFINGVLDKLVKEYEQTNRMKKSGRGLRQ